jgi:hypothetical protein
MNNLGNHLALRFQHTRVSTDIDDAIEFHQNVVRLTDEKDLAMHSRMDNLATALINPVSILQKIFGSRGGNIGRETSC